MNPYRNMTLREAKEALSGLLAKRREAKEHRNKSLLQKIASEQAQIKQRIRFLMESHTPDEDQIAKRNRKLEDRRERISKFGFAVSSHALHRYRLRFEPETTLETLYQKLLETDLVAYLKIKPSGQCAIHGSMVAVIKDRLILTFKDVDE
jgi:hypothetical protein